MKEVFVSTSRRVPRVVYTGTAASGEDVMRGMLKSLPPVEVILKKDIKYKIILDFVFCDKKFLY